MRRPSAPLDHVTPAEHGGPTAETNAQGLCAACNHAKQAPGWHASPDRGHGAGRAVTTRTPTGHRYTSRPPPLPGQPDPRPPTRVPWSRLEATFTDYVLTA